MSIKIVFSKITNMLYSFGMLISALFITWCLLSRVDFFYPSLHQWLDIQSTVTEFGAENKYKKGFEKTTYPQHVQYFSDIVIAINNDGKGLNDITYPYNGRNINLLRKPEVLHLEDVARLLNGLTYFSYAMMLVMLLILIHRYRYKIELPSVKAQVVQLIVLVGTLTAVSGIIGFKAVFYWLHQVSFPAENEWFFYYQDSLMTTMMQAPTLFGPISAFIVVGACLLFVVLNLLITAGYKRLLIQKI